jgi:transcriptional regulator
MFSTAFNRVEEEPDIRAMVAGVGAAELITTGKDGYPQATLLPILWKDDVVLAHMARANPHWREIAPGTPTLLVCAGAQAYISPSWYPAKFEHGKVVPTWNYSTVHLTGLAEVHDDVAWLRRQVSELTDHHEGARDHPWHVTDAPPRFVEAQLRGIVGIEIRVKRVDAKAKLSQNRSEADQRGVIEGLQREDAPGATAVAEAMSSER